METKKQKLLRLWNDLKNKYNNRYLNLSVVNELNKRGIKVF